MMPAFWLAPSLKQPVGRTVAMPWEYFAARVKSAKPAQAKENLARWAPVEFRGNHRRLANVRWAHGVVLDVEDGSSLDRILAALPGLFLIVHSTWNATAEHPRWRIIVPLDRPVDAEEYDRVFRWLASLLARFDVTADCCARDASRAWAVPALPPSGHYVAHVADGAFACAEDGLAVIPKPEPISIPAPGPMTDTYSRRVERASRYLASMPGAISGSGGHATTFKAAAKLVRGFSLDPADALRLLVEIHNPLCAPPWSLRELQHKVRQATRSRLPAGFLAEKTRAA